MRRDLMEILCCPLDKGELQLRVGREEGGEIETGEIVCKTCGRHYPIEDGIPNLLPPDDAEAHGG